MGSRDESTVIGVEGPKRGPRSRAPLFNRLQDDEPKHREEAHPQRVLTRDRILESVRGELSRLLNTRCSDTLEGLQGQERTVANYGLPDFFTLSPTNDTDRQRLARLIVEAVRAYEPRLRNPLVEVTPDTANGRALRVTLTGTLVVEQLTEPVSFPLVIAERGGAIRQA
ncbi:MAG TPA: type VI secretion system baseplate subunit TssE [Vicinamibacterales bacterium]|nr:type VI secretion system baseplate subunit TssE [Vicinamibacterales bacterium]